MKIYDYKKIKNVSSEKVYSQGEVDDLLKDKSDDRTVAGLVKRSNRILLSISSHRFPFDFFPNVLNIEDGRITVINRHLFSSEVHSIDIKDISNVFINTVVFFSQLIVISKTFEENEIKISDLRIGEAIFARRIIEGLRVFIRKGIDTSAYSTKELVDKLKELSTTEIVT